MKQDRHEGAASRRRLPGESMHQDVELWCDCCSCEAEPRWRALEEEMEQERVDDEQASNRP